MRKMKQLLAAGLMMSMIAATSAGTSVFASTPEVVETNESTKTESSKMLDGTRYGKIIKEMPLTISFRM